MKKSIVLTVVMLLALVCSVAAQSGDYAGIWYLYGMSDGENMYNAADFGFEASMTLNEDGTAVSDGNGELSEGTWEVTETGITTVFEDNPMDLTFEDGFLVADLGEESGLMFFSKEQPAPAFTLADPAEGVTAEDFEGTWTPVKIGMDGVGYFDWSMMGDEMESLGLKASTVVVKDGLVSTFGEDPSDEYKFQEDGTYAYVNEDPDLSFLNSTMTIREDGLMTINYLGMFTFVMERVEEAEN